MKQNQKKTSSYEAPSMEAYYIKHSILLHSLSGDANINNIEDGENIVFIRH